MTQSPESSKIDPPSIDVNNNDLLVWALFLLGGIERWVDVEEMFLKAFELAPARLSWRTRPDIPDYKKASKALQHIESTDHRWHPLLEKRGPHERKLSIAGQAWCEKYGPQLSELYSGDAVVSSPKTQKAGRRVSDVEKSELFERWKSDPTTQLHEHELAVIFRCLPGSPRATWVGRFDETSVAAARNGRTDISEFVEAARATICK